MVLKVNDTNVSSYIPEHKNKFKQKNQIKINSKTVNTANYKNEKFHKLASDPSQCILLLYNFGSGSRLIFATECPFTNFSSRSRMVTPRRTGQQHTWPLS